jgi:GDPmannose 4,6-dehydratase
MFLAGSSEMFGSASAAQQNELTAFNPRSTYGLARVAAYDVVRGYRKEGLFACTGILYNHESPRRAPFFLPRQVSLGVAAIKHGRQEKLMLGNLSAVRDWGYAPDYVEAMWTILQAKEPDDFVVATGKLHTVEQLVATAFSSVDLDYRDFVGVDPQFVRPVEAFPLCGDPARIQAATGWRARREFSAIIAEMVAADIALQSRDGMRA